MLDVVHYSSIIDSHKTSTFLRLLNRSRHTYAVRIREVPAEFDREFQEKFRNAMTSMINAPEYGDVFARFRSAYEYRKQFPWLEESRNGSNGHSQDGLNYALRIALATYIVPERMLTSTSATIRKSSPGDPEWSDAFMKAISATIDEGFSLERFENRLCRMEGNVENISQDKLCKHIVAALENYSDQRSVGLSPDPF